MADFPAKTPKARRFELAPDVPVADIPAVQEHAHLIAETATRRLILIAEANSLWRFVEDSHYEGDEYTGPYFAATHYSGLYESADAAERDARAMLPWLRDGETAQP